MGAVLKDTNVPIIKGSNGVIAIDTDVSVEVECIKCGRCQDVCPMELKPLYFAKLVKENSTGEALLEYKIRDCMECGCCQYICSSKIPLVSYIKQGKKIVMEMKK